MPNLPVNDLLHRIPLSLYIHLPWCVQKCPYCDFNSHALKNDLPEEIYTEALLQELQLALPLIEDRTIISIFFGGGTPSLFSPKAIGRILNGVAQRLNLAANIEITLEANPGTIDQVHFHDYYAAGINRLSLGLQSLQNQQLTNLGRIHSSEDAIKAVEVVKNAGFSNINLDIMYGLSNQTVSDAMLDLTHALALEPTHFSWYQLTLEPNTLFYHEPPTLPSEDTIWEIQTTGQQYLVELGYPQYEVSAYARAERECRHNLNYWEYGDYLGIGAGAHSKITQANGNITRFSQVKHPKDYLIAAKRVPQGVKILTKDDLIFEFMLNALRLTHGVSTNLFTERTGLPLTAINNKLAEANKRGLIQSRQDKICTTEKGARFLNELVALFLDN